jgi:predicted RNA-binding protein YlqC (UPF0109 family)
MTEPTEKIKVDLSPEDLGKVIEKVGLTNIKVLPQMFMKNDEDLVYVLVSYKHFAAVSALIKTNPIGE